MADGGSICLEQRPASSGSLLPKTDSPESGHCAGRTFSSRQITGQTSRRVSVYVYAKDDCFILGVAGLGHLAEEVPMLEISLLKIMAATWPAACVVPTIGPPPSPHSAPAELSKRTSRCG